MKFKRILPLLLSVCMVGSTFVGCTDASNNDNDSDDNTGITDTTGGDTTGDTSGDTGGDKQDDASGTGDGSTDSGTGNTSSDTSGDTSGDTDKDTSGDTSGEDTSGGDASGEDTSGGDTSGEDTSGGTSGDTSGDDTEEEDTTNGGTVTTTVYMVGDSTMCSFSDNYYIPRYGYGTQLENYLNENVTVVNLALSGRSSLSFLSESNYSTLKSSIGEGDYLIIGFGHNDEKSAEPARFTDPNPDYQTQYSSSGSLSFQYNLYENYIKLAEDAGATPILCTPIVRYNANADYTGSSGHVTSDGDYAQAIRDLGADTGTTVIDLTALTAADYVSKTTDAQYYHAYTTYKEDDAGNKTPSGIDTTHINMYGAKMVCYELVTALQNTSNQLKHYVKSDITEPTYDTDFAASINTSYEKPDYSGFDSSKYANLTGNWYTSAFGTLGGSSKVSDYTYGYDSTTGAYTITAGNGSKIADANDGFGTIFMQIGKSDNFTITATVTLTTVGSSATSQSAFGLMLRDDIYKDTSETGILSNYVAAGVLGTGSGKAIFSRENAALTKESNSVTANAGSSFEISITRTGQTVVVKVGSYSQTYTDFDFFSVDNDYMYLCMFATRDITATFTNVSYSYDGVAQDA